MEYSSLCKIRLVSVFIALSDISIRKKSSTHIGYYFNFNPFLLYYCMWIYDKYVARRWFLLRLFLIITFFFKDVNHHSFEIWPFIVPSYFQMRHFTVAFLYLVSLMFCSFWTYITSKKPLNEVRVNFINKGSINVVSHMYHPPSTTFQTSIILEIKTHIFGDIHSSSRYRCKNIKSDNYAQNDEILFLQRQ